MVGHSLDESPAPHGPVGQKRIRVVRFHHDPRGTPTVDVVHECASLQLDPIGLVRDGVGAILLLGAPDDLPEPELPVGHPGTVSGGRPARFPKERAKRDSYGAAPSAPAAVAMLMSSGLTQTRSGGRFPIRFRAASESYATAPTYSPQASITGRRSSNRFVRRYAPSTPWTVCASAASASIGAFPRSALQSLNVERNP